MLPLSGSSSPATMLNRVLLPQPLGPTTVTNSPGAMAASKPETAVTLAKLFDSPFISRSGRASAAEVEAVGPAASAGSGRLLDARVKSRPSTMYNERHFPHTQNAPLSFIPSNRCANGREGAAPARAAMTRPPCGPYAEPTFACGGELGETGGERPAFMYTEEENECANEQYPCTG